MKNKKGFTLVELLAVIVILAVILVIAVPQITEVIKNTKKASLESSTKMIIRGAETAYETKEMLGESTSNIKCSEVAEINSNDYETCNISFDSEGNATVIINGKANGKFNNLACEGTKESISCIEGVIEVSTPAVCFATEEIVNLADYDINKSACETYVANWGYSAADVNLFCSGGITSDEWSIDKEIEEGYTQDLIDVGVIENVVYEENSISITGYDATCPKDIVIPKTINGKQVTEIGDDAFTTKREFNIGQMINEIKDYNITNLNMNYVKKDSYQIIPCSASIISGIGVTSVILPMGIETIGYRAFYKNNLTEITIPSSVTYIGDSAFFDNNISVINLPTTPLSLGCYAFDNNPIIDTDYTVPSNVSFDYCIV